MSLFHAVAFVDHQSAHLLQFAPDERVEQHVHEQLKFTRQHHSGVRTEHEFFGSVCDAFDGIAEVLVVGGNTSVADFQRYVEKHRPQTMPRIAGYEVVDHPTDNQLIALARSFFVKHDRMVGTRVPT
ncbi:hypothetical protein VLK31_19415 [Variovorax sp. H27-G14]|uniref:hypothetical protein n=1 Tax=Variovorax sp. H27-G14 TaxID=3111914 RepID=UPI0038FD0C53